MKRVHGPVVAGTFYPWDAGELSAMVSRLINEAATRPLPGRLRGLVVPHAGYVYSGPVAASAFAQLDGNEIGRLVLVGPAHFARFTGIAALTAEAWATPLGEVPVDAIENPAVSLLPDAYVREHSLEVQLPFLQIALEGFSVQPLLTGIVEPTTVADVLDELLGADGFLIVSTDLSHYYPYDTARRLDRVTADAVVNADDGALGPESACGRTGLQAALQVARRRGWRVELLDLRNSGDTAGPRHEVVGYGAFAVMGSEGRAGSTEDGPE